MCGIVGIVASRPVAADLVEALRRLEYRGYDSAGIATVENGHLERRRAEGKLRNLESRLHTEPLAGRTGIGHTRWAGHDDLMIAARQGSPLAIGHGSGEMYLGSDAIALAPFTGSVTYLEEGDWAV